MDFCALPNSQFMAIATSGVASATATVLTPSDQAALAALFGAHAPAVPAELHTFLFLAPVYRGNGTPTSPAARASALLGWVGGEFDANALVASAVAHKARLHVILSHVNHPGGTTVITSAGRRFPAKFAFAGALDAGGRWLIRVEGDQPAGGPSSTTYGLAVGLAGVFATVLLFVLIRVLASSRGKALDLVDRATLELRDAHADRLRLLDRTVQAAEEERVRLAADLHDGPIQRLAALGYDVARCARRFDQGDGRIGLELLVSVETDLAREIAGLRQLMSELRPPVLDERGLDAAVRDFAAAFGARHGLRTNVRVDLPNRLAPDAETVLYRIMQEAATNVVKHARASALQFTLSSTSDGVVFVISDNGIGIPSDDSDEQSLIASGHFGVAGMRARLTQVGGRLDVHGGAKGTTVLAWLPQEAAWPLPAADAALPGESLIGSTT
jgi:two-component system NarL family sensor kinase